MADIQKTLQTLSDEYSKLQTGISPPSSIPSPSHLHPISLSPLTRIRAAQTELQSTIEARQKLESQHQENKGVSREFTALSDKQGAGKIYKLVGPVLLAQDKSEAVMAVQARLEFIEKEMYAFFFFSFWIGRRRPEGPNSPACLFSASLPPTLAIGLNVGLELELTGAPGGGGEGEGKRKTEEEIFFPWYSMCLLTRPLCGVWSYRKRVEKQIKELQVKSENTKMQVRPSPFLSITAGVLFWL